MVVPVAEVGSAVVLVLGSGLAVVSAEAVEPEVGAVPDVSVPSDPVDVVPSPLSPPLLSSQAELSKRAGRISQRTRCARRMTEPYVDRPAWLRHRCARGCHDA